MPGYQKYNAEVRVVYHIISMFIYFYFGISAVTCTLRARNIYCSLEIEYPTLKVTMFHLEVNMVKVITTKFR